MFICIKSSEDYILGNISVLKLWLYSEKAVGKLTVNDLLKKKKIIGTDFW